MGNQVKGLVVTVALADGIQEDYCDEIMKAILLIKGVVGVKVVDDHKGEWLFRQRLKSELGDMILDWYKKL